MRKLLSHLDIKLSLFLIFLFCFQQGQSQTYDKESDNQIGDTAINFSYVANGEIRTLYELIEEKKTNVLVLFHSPECEVCAKTKKKLVKSKQIKKLQNEGKLTVLAIAVETNQETWESNCKNLPIEWVNAYCQECEPITKSYIWTVPTLFLIGKDLRVIDREFEHHEKNHYN